MWNLDLRNKKGNEHTSRAIWGEEQWEVEREKNG
jgi:hypothetical protein